MKPLAFTFLFFVLSSVCISQPTLLPVDSITGEITYSRVINVDSTNSKILFQRAREWFALAFVSANDVVQLEDSEAGKLIGKGTVKVNWGYVRFTTELQVKESRYKYIFTVHEYVPTNSNIYTHGDLREEKPGGGIMSMGFKNWNKIRIQAHNEIIHLIKDLRKTMAGNPDKSDDW